jgi:hypothetical protein
VEEQADNIELVPGQIVTELRALEWELSEVVRRVEVLRNQVRDLSERAAHDLPKETS